MTSDPEVIFEFHPVGNSVRVSAFDPPTLTEVFIVAPANIPRSEMKHAALQKLRYVLEKNKLKDSKTKEKLSNNEDDDFFV